MLDIQRISKTFNPGTVNEKKAITDLSLHLNKGEFVTVIGSNGAGKSTLFNAIAGSFYVDGGWFSRLTQKARARFCDRLALLDMGLEDRLNQPVGLLSGGQRQALTLLMATMNPPWLLLLDEHTAALDPGTAEKVLELTKRIVAEGNITCLMVTHNMQQALELGTRTLMMADGRIVLDVSGADRAGMTVEDLIHRFKAGTGKTLSNDRMLLS